MTPGVVVFVLRFEHISYVFFIYIISLKILIFSTPRQRPDKLEYSNGVLGGVHQNFKFHDLQGRDSCARAWSYKSYHKNALVLY